jgi:hypothetical protein
VRQAIDAVDREAADRDPARHQIVERCSQPDRAGPVGAGEDHDPPPAAEDLRQCEQRRRPAGDLGG